ncbi:MAG: SGNH/GDSL hydrolase family protein, partial [Clostridia bacterium]|nr:SGNH/GDSL hydrolase family protein [Clostridia bacterium]
MKKTACILLAVAAALTLFGCGGGNTAQSSSQSQEHSLQPVSVPEDVTQQVSEPVSQSGEPEKVYTDGKRLIVFGDSITALGSWGRTAAEALNMYFFNGAMGGITSAQGIDRFPAYVAGHDADFVTLLFGMNDLIMVSAGKPRVAPEQFEENMKTLVEMVRECGATPVLLTANPLDPDRFWSAQGQSPALYESVGGDPLAWLEVYNGVTR